MVDLVVTVLYLYMDMEQVEAVQVEMVTAHRMFQLVGNQVVYWLKLVTVVLMQLVTNDLAELEHLVLL